MADNVTVRIVGEDNLTPVSKKAAKNLTGSAKAIDTAFKRIVSVAAFTIVLRNLGIQIQKTIKIFSDFELGIVKMATLVDDTRPIFGKFKEEIKSLAVEFGQTTKSLSGAGFDILSAGITDTATALDILRASAKLATAGFTDTKTAASALITLLRNAGEQFRDAADAADFLILTQRVARTTVGALSTTFGKVIGIAASVKINIEDLAAAFVVTQDTGLSTEEVMTALRSAINQLKSASPEAEKAAEQFGLVLKSSALEGEGFANALLKIGALEADERDQLVKNIRAQITFAAVAGDTARFQEARIALTKRLGAVDRELIKVQETLTFKQDQFNSALEVFRINVGELIAVRLKDFFEGLVDAMISSGSVVNLLSQNINALLLVLVQLGPILKIIGLILITVLTSLSIFILALSNSLQILIILGNQVVVVVAQLLRLNKATREVGKQLEATANATLKRSIDLLTKNSLQIESLGKSYGQFIQTLGKFGDTQDDTTNAVKEAIKALKKLQEELEESNNGAKEFDENLGSLGLTADEFKTAFSDLFRTSLQDVNDLDQAVQNLEDSLERAFFDRLSNLIVELSFSILGLTQAFKLLNDTASQSFFSSAFIKGGGILGSLGGLFNRKDTKKTTGGLRDKPIGADGQARASDKANDLADNFDKLANSKDKVIDKFDEFTAGGGGGSPAGDLLAGIQPVGEDALLSVDLLASGLNGAAIGTETVSAGFENMAEKLNTFAIAYVATTALTTTSALVSLTILTAASIAAAAALASAWAPAALFASIATFGGAAVAGSAALGMAAVFTAPLAQPGFGLGAGGPQLEIAVPPKLAEGGIVTGPTLAMIGEAGPEAVVPLNELDNFGGGVRGMTVNIKIEKADISDPRNIDKLALSISRRIGFELDRPKFTGARKV